MNTNSQFEGLINDLQGIDAETETLSKALAADDTSADDARIAEAAGEDNDANDGEAEAGAEAEKPMAKSFKVILEDGTEIEATDGADLVKALTERLEALESSSKTALEAAVGVITRQGALMKSLVEKVDALSNKPLPRKAVVSIAERPAAQVEEMTKSQPDQISGEEFLAKALAACAEGRISSHQLSTAEIAIGMGQAPDRAVLAAVLAPSA